MTSISNSDNGYCIARMRMVLVETSHSGNIGAAARALKTMGLSRLYLVNPRCEVDAQAVARSSGATDVLDNITVCDSLDEALAGCHLVLGTTARSRSLDWPSLAPRDAAAKLAQGTAQGDVALVFGTERTGLSNADLDHCHYRVTIPANPDYSSLNLAAAVQVLAYECHMALFNDASAPAQMPETPPATADDMEYFYAHLQQVLELSEFLNPNNPRHLMRRLRRLFNRAQPDQNEVNILRGILTALTPRPPVH